MCFSYLFFLVVDLEKSMENYLDIHANLALEAFAGLGVLTNF